MAFFGVCHQLPVWLEVVFLAGVLGAALHRGTEEPQLAPNQQTGLRLACNLCKHLQLRQWMQTHNAALMDRFAPCCSSTNKAVRFAFATFMLNLSVFFSSTAKADTEAQAQVGCSSSAAPRFAHVCVYVSASVCLLMCICAAVCRPQPSFQFEVYLHACGRLLSRKCVCSGAPRSFCTCAGPLSFVRASVCHPA